MCLLLLQMYAIVHLVGLLILCSSPLIETRTFDDEHFQVDALFELTASDRNQVF